ncbi:MAG TPA: hypothetical protein IAB45_03280 [Candidatus Onthousia faecavium]|nr:hypothetical protein [Candidatus Onthousia faecavium]
MLFSKKKIIERDFKSYTEQDFIEKIGITKQQYDDILENYLVLMEDGYYYHKEIGEGMLINELIGRYLCHKVDLATTEIEILDEKACFFHIVTPNYREKGFTYLEPKDNFEYGEKINDFNDDLFKDLPLSLKIDLFKLTAVDLMMEQIDRYARNMELATSRTMETRLAPIIDFEYAFDKERDYRYYNPYLALEKKSESLIKFCNKYPDFYPYVLKTLSVDSEEIFSYLKNAYYFEPSFFPREHIITTVDRNQKILEKIR